MMQTFIVPYGNLIDMIHHFSVRIGATADSICPLIGKMRKGFGPARSNKMLQEEKKMLQEEYYISLQQNRPLDMQMLKSMVVASPVPMLV